MQIHANGAPIYISERWTGNNLPKDMRFYPEGTVTHDTGNDRAGADALMHWRFVVNGGGVDSVSFHNAIDDRRIVQIVPYGMGTWNASDGYNGIYNNRYISIEDCVNRDGNYARMLGHHVWYLAAVKQIPEIFDWMNYARVRSYLKGINTIEDTWHQQTAPDHKYCPRHALDLRIVPSPLLTTDETIKVALPVTNPQIRIFSRARDKIIRCNSVDNEHRQIQTDSGGLIIEPMNIIRYRSRLAITTLWGTIIMLHTIRFSGLYVHGDGKSYDDRTARALATRILPKYAVRGRYVLHLNTGE